MSVAWHAIYFVIGLAGFVFWWTREHDLTIGDAAFGSLIAFILGPLTWPVGLVLAGLRSRRTRRASRFPRGRSTETVLVKRRRPK